MVMLNDVNVEQGRRMIVATVDGERFEFPEAWAMGYCQSRPGTDARDAAVAWCEQAKMEREHGAQRLARALPHAGPLAVKLTQGDAADLSDSEIERCMSVCVAPSVCAALTRVLRDAGELVRTNEGWSPRADA